MTCWEILGVADTASVLEVKQAYKRAAAGAHPDVGGTAQEFTRVHLAYQQALAIAEAPITCPDCVGVGSVRHMVAWHYVDVACSFCGSTGFVRRIR